ncbi:MAG TPA: methyltransferase domain-containing protein [Bryobacteraceae bacterium]|jgi:ubiquinone/menaquinone biosynthesis C-methylase UbiE
MRKWILITAAAGIGLAAASAQTPADNNRRYQTPEGRAEVSKILNDPHRDGKQKPAELVAAMGLRPGMSVVDIGTGTGYMLPYLDGAVGENGHVFAEDIFDDFLRQARERVKAKGYHNVTFIKGTVKSASLAPDSVDEALILDVYHHFDFPTDMLTSIAKGLKRHGRLVIVDYYKRPGAMPGSDAVQHIRVDYDGVVKEVEANGFRLVEKKEQIPNSQYMAVFEKK